MTQLGMSWHNGVGWPAASQQRGMSSWRLARCKLQLALLLGKLQWHHTLHLLSLLLPLTVLKQKTKSQPALQWAPHCTVPLSAQPQIPLP